MSSTIKRQIYAIRQALLRDYKRYVAAPVTPSELVEISYERAIVADWDQALEECYELKLMGYLEPVPGFGGEYLRITRNGLCQVAPEFGRDPYIWGPGAA